MVTLYPVPLSLFWTVTQGVHVFVLPIPQEFVNIFCVVAPQITLEKFEAHFNMLMAKFPKAERYIIQMVGMNDGRECWSQYKRLFAFQRGM